MEVLTVIGSLALAVLSIWQARQDPTYGRKQVWAGVRGTIGYLVYLFAGVGLIFLMPLQSKGDAVAVAAAVFLGAWSLYGAVWMVRLVPMAGTKPAWMLRHWSLLDWVLIAVIILAFGVGLTR